MNSNHGEAEWSWPQRERSQPSKLQKPQKRDGYKEFLKRNVITPVDATKPELTGNYELWKSGVPNPTKHSIVWVDENTLLMSGIMGREVSGAPYRRGPGRLFVWRLGEAPELYAADRWRREVPKDNARHFCADRKNIYYDDISQPDQNLRRVGKLGREVLQPRGISAFKHPHVAELGAGRDRCRRTFDPRMEGHRWYAEADERYYIDFGPPRVKGYSGMPSGPIRLIDSLDWKITGLDIPLEDVRIRSTRHFRGTNRILIWDSSTSFSSPWEAQKCMPFRMLSPETANLKEYCLPYHKGFGGSTQIVDTKAGIFFYMHLNAALYRLNNGKAELVLKGVVDDVRVSPSGCKIAFNYLRSFRSEAYVKTHLRTPQVLKLCNS